MKECQAKSSAGGETVSESSAPLQSGIEAGARALAKFWGYEWECCCSSERGLDCDCGDALYEERVDAWDETPSRQDLRAAAKAVLLSQIEEQAAQPRSDEVSQRGKTQPDTIIPHKEDWDDNSY